MQKNILNVTLKNIFTTLFLVSIIAGLPFVLSTNNPQSHSFAEIFGVTSSDFNSTLLNNVTFNGNLIMNGNISNVGTFSMNVLDGANYTTNFLLGSKKNNITEFLTGIGNVTFFSGFNYAPDEEPVYTMIRTSAGETVFGGGIAGDSYRRFVMNAKGDFWWGKGTSAVDTNLYRSGNNELSTNDTFVVRNSKNIKVRTDGYGLFLGASDDSSITYNGSQMTINPNEVGTGALVVDGKLHIGGDITGFGTYDFTVKSPSGGIILKRTGPAESFILMFNNNTESSGGGQIRGLNDSLGLRFTGYDPSDEYMRIENGKVGIGTKTPKYLLEVGGNFSVNNSFFINDNGNVGIGTKFPTHKLNVVGDTNITGNLIVNNSLGLTGNYSLGSCWQYFVQGLLKSTNCTSI